MNALALLLCLGAYDSSNILGGRARPHEDYYEERPAAQYPAPVCHQKCESLPPLYAPVRTEGGAFVMGSARPRDHVPPGLRVKLVTLTCAGCGEPFQATEQGARSGRKWCSGTCQDRNGSFGPKRIEWMKAWRRRKKASAA